MPDYRIVQEFHVMPETTWNGKQVASIEFHYAIRRADDSLVFRARTQDQADDLLSRLFHFTRRAAA